MRRGKQRTTVAITAIIAALLLLLAAPASANNNGATQFSGVGFLVGECEGESGEVATILMKGDLYGCWYVTSITSTKWHPQSGTYQERGTELFDGCLRRDGQDDVCGTFETTYTFSAKFADGDENEPDFATEVFGRCQHPIVAGSGTGGFSGVTGRVDFKDNLDVEPIELDYRGHVTLGT